MRRAGMFDMALESHVQVAWYQVHISFALTEHNCTQVRLPVTLKQQPQSRVYLLLASFLLRGHNTGNSAKVRCLGCATYKLHVQCQGLLLKHEMISAVLMEILHFL